MSCNLCFQNQNQESSDGTQVPDGDGLSDTRIHKDGNDEERDHAVSIMLFIFFTLDIFFFQNRMKCACFHVFLQHSIVFFHTPFSSNSHMMDFFCKFMTYSVCNLSIRVQEKRDDTEEEALQNKGADSNAPQHAPNP